MIYYKAAFRAGIILLCMFAVITAILVICAWLPSFISGKIGRRALADPEPWAERSGRRRKTRMEQIEWIRFYPLKKLILALLWLLCAVVSAMAFQVYILAGMLVVWDAEDIGFTLFICLLTAASSVPVARYLLLQYHSMPRLNRILSKKEMDGLMEREHFQRVQFSNEALNRFHPIYRSMNWLVVDGTAISKRLAVIAQLNCHFHRHHGLRYVWLEVYYLNGRKVKTKLGNWSVRSGERENRKALENFLAGENLRVEDFGPGGEKRLLDHIAEQYGRLLPELKTESEKILYLLKNDTTEIKEHIL